MVIFKVYLKIQEEIWVSFIVQIILGKVIANKTKKEREGASIHCLFFFFFLLLYITPLLLVFFYCVFLFMACLSCVLPSCPLFSTVFLILHGTSLSPLIYNLLTTVSLWAYLISSREKCIMYDHRLANVMTSKSINFYVNHICL